MKLVWTLHTNFLLIFILLTVNSVFKVSQIHCNSRTGMKKENNHRAGNRREKIDVYVCEKDLEISDLSQSQLEAAAKHTDSHFFSFFLSNQQSTRCIINI